MVKLNLGACDRHIEGFLSVDIAPPADIVTDLRERWPWDDSSVSEVMALDVFEHMPDKRHSMNELWRVLCAGGLATIEVPTIDGVGAVCDPTHVSFWSAGDFEYYERGNFARERFRGNPYYGINADFKILRVARDSYQNPFGETVMKIRVQLEAVKS